jgi:mersacidin/lichenicidin family type 2 lantibiotic
MSNIDIARAWKDEEYRNSLTEEQKKQLPENPAGQAEITDEDLGNVSGGMRSETAQTQCGGSGCKNTSGACNPF